MRWTLRWGSQTLVDLEGRFDVTDNIRVSLGAENILDEYPDTFEPNRNTTGNTSFWNYSPFWPVGQVIDGRVRCTLDAIHRLRRTTKGFGAIG